MPLQLFPGNLATNERIEQIAGMKKLLHRHFGYGDKPRLPLLPMDDETADLALNNPFFMALLEFESKL